eukprot:3537123-Amphidinium_carterae.1
MEKYPSPFLQCTLHAVTISTALFNCKQLCTTIYLARQREQSHDSSDIMYQEDHAGESRQSDTLQYILQCHL